MVPYWYQSESKKCAGWSDLERFWIYQHQLWHLTSRKQAINSLKNGKAPGHDNLNAGLFKADPELDATIPLFTKIWEQEEIPSDWSRGVIIKIPKKGSLSDCNNWRGISLLSVPSKIFCKVIILHITKAVDDILQNEQAGFCKGTRMYRNILSNVLNGTGSCA